MAIAAPCQVVWDVLVDLESYPDWNPVEIQVKGEPVVGGTLEHTARLPGRKPMTFKAKIIEATPSRPLAWKGRIVLPGLCDVTHHFEIDRLSDHDSRLRQFEHFSGAVVPFMRGTLRDTQAAFALANQAIKQRAESIASERPRERTG
jgi:hypothetical protein